jgi:hypothetical protein
MKKYEKALIRLAYSRIDAQVSIPVKVNQFGL